MKADTTPPVELEACRMCGGRAKLHHGRDGKWYVRCEKTKDQCTESLISRLTVCRLWNVRNWA